MANSPDDLTAQLISAGASKTIYAFVMPETERILDQVLDGSPTGPEARRALHALYHDAWTKKQDPIHEEFFKAWLHWSAPVLALDGEKFPFRYPTAGASEGLREAINAYGNRARVENFAPVIHVFDGEYEGYGAYASAAGIEVRQHVRGAWRAMLEKVGPTDQIYLSQPSAIDGNLWPEYEPFMEALHQKQPRAQLVLDLTYVGAVRKPYHVNANHPNVRLIVFSLSKPMGVYYHRIGGVLSREQMPSLYGNMWFKNILALKFGTALLKAHDVHELPRRYAGVQQQAAESVGRALGFELHPSDVWLLATAAPRTPATPLDRLLLRGTSPEARVRICLSPMIDRLVHR